MTHQTKPVLKGDKWPLDIDKLSYPLRVGKEGPMVNIEDAELFSDLVCNIDARPLPEFDFDKSLPWATLDPVEGGAALWSGVESE